MQYKLTCTKENKYQLAINGTVIPEDVLEENRLEWEERTKHIDNLKDSPKDSYAEKEAEVAKTLDDEILLVGRNSLGTPEMVHPHSKVFGEICESLINASKE